MKKLTLLLLVFTTLYSCGDDIEFNSPAMQGNKNGNLWRATSYASDIDFGGFLIEGSNGIETVQLVTHIDLPGTFTLGGESSSVAILKDLQGIVYSTANTPNESLSVYPAEGQIIVDFVENTNPKTLTGSFWFYAYSQDGLKTVNFNEGVFYKVPLLGGLVVIDNGSACLQASQANSIAANNFAATDTSMIDYTDLCNAYKNTLNEKINSCGDSSGALQAIIDSLGDCLP